MYFLNNSFSFTCSFSQVHLWHVFIFIFKWEFSHVINFHSFSTSVDLLIHFASDSDWEFSQVITNLPKLIFRFHYIKRWNIFSSYIELYVGNCKLNYTKHSQKKKNPKLSIFFWPSLDVLYGYVTVVSV